MTRAYHDPFNRMPEYLPAASVCSRKGPHCKWGERLIPPAIPELVGIQVLDTFLGCCTDRADL